MRIAFQRDAACFQHIRPVGHRQRHLGVLLHQQNAGALRVDVLDDVEDFLHQHRRQTHRGFIHQQERGLGHQRAANRQHLLLAARQRAAQLLQALFQAGKAAKDAIEAGLDFGFVRAGVSAHFQVFHHRQRRKDLAAFRHLHDAQPHDVLRRRQGEVVAAEAHVARSGAAATRRW